MKNRNILFVLFCLCGLSAFEVTASDELGKNTKGVQGSFSNMTLEEHSTPDVTNVFLDKRIIVSNEKKAEYLSDETDEEDNNSYLSTNDIVYKLEQTITSGVTKKEVLILSLASSSINDKTFIELTERLIPLVTFKNGEGILDLSFNSLTSHCAQNIIRWVDEKNIKFINLHGNSQCSMKYIKDLCKTLKELLNQDKEKIKSIMSHIIFLPQYYIYQAEKKVKIYNQMCEHGYLPNDWAEIQRAYYRASSKKPISFLEELLPYDPDADLSFGEE